MPKIPEQNKYHFGSKVRQPLYEDCPDIKRLSTMSLLQGQDTSKPDLKAFQLKISMEQIATK